MGWLEEVWKCSGKCDTISPNTDLTEGLAGLGSLGSNMKAKREVGDPAWTVRKAAKQISPISGRSSGPDVREYSEDERRSWSVKAEDTTPGTQQTLKTKWISFPAVAL